MPLANLLAPELLRKAQEIEQAIGPPVPPEQRQNGYLQAGYEKTPYDPQGLMDKPGSKPFNGPQSPGMVGLGQLQRSDDQNLKAFARGVVQGGSGTAPSQKAYLAPTAPERPMKIVKKGEKTGTKGRKLQLPAGAAVGMNERGESVDAKGKKLGYLGQPALVTPTNETSLRGADRRSKDVTFGDTDRFGLATLKKDYGEHLKEYEANRGEFPGDYFDGMTAKKKAEIIKGVKELRAREKTATEGTGA